VPAVSTGPVVTAAGKLVSWLWVERRHSQELQGIVRRALRLSICRYDPCAENVDERVKLLEDQMWEQAKNATVDDRSLKASIKRKFRGTGSAKLNLPGWQEELQRWVELAAAAVGWDESKAPQPDCLNFPRASALAERFPHMFYREVQASAASNEHLLTALDEADNLAQGATRRDATAQWQAAAVAMIGTAIGLGVDEIASLSGAAEEIGSGIGGALVGVAVLRLVKTLRASFTSSQQELHEQARVWVHGFLSEQTERKGERTADQMFHEWVCAESAHPRSSAPADASRLAELATLIEKGRSCRERQFVKAASALHEALACDRHSEQARHALHRLVWRLWGVPAGA
jgi:hypothetical protein